MECREGFRESEACVWGRSYLPLSRMLEPLIVTPIAFLILTALTYFLSRQTRAPSD